MSKETTGQVFGLMDNLLEKIRAEKRAAQKKATDGSEPTAHPVMNADDGTQPAREGSRSAENESDVEKDYGVLGNTGQEDANAASSENQADSIGTQSQAADEVKGNVAKPKPDKDGPAESGAGDASAGHPSNQTFSGEDAKYGAAIDSGNKLLGLLAEAMGKTAAENTDTDEGASENAQKKEGEEVPSPASDAGDKEKVPTSKDKEKEAADKTEGEKTAEVEKTAEELKKEAAEKYREDAEAGYMAAGLLAEQMGFGKQAEEETTAVNARLEGIIKTAQQDAVLLADFLGGINKGQEKAAAEKQAALAKLAQPPMDLGPAPEEGMGEGVPAEALMDEEAALGEGGGDEAVALELLADALEEAGVGPEELAALAEGEGGMGEEMPTEEGAEAVAEETGAEEEVPKEASTKLKAKQRLMALLSR